MYLKRLARLIILLILCLSIAVGASSVLAGNPPTSPTYPSPPGYSDNTPGAQKAYDACLATIKRQNAKGITGTKKGNSSKSQKRLGDTAVANCDQYWIKYGANNPH